MAEAARVLGIALSVCGELAGDRIGTQVLVGLGVHRLSMAAPAIPMAARIIQQRSLADLQREARAALDDRSAADVRRRFSSGD